MDDIVARARACVGARFRPWGRDPALGLDCVGLAGVALGVAVPRDYALRGGEVAAVTARIAAAGLARVDEAGPGDLVLVGEGAGQLHLAVMTEAGFVHADARLGRVVETPGRPAGVIGAWRVRK